MDLNALMAGRLDAARRRSLDLLAPVPDEGLVRQHSPLMSPLVWDLAHVGNYEEQWLLRALGGPAVGPQWDSVYDAFRHPRRDRPSLPMMGPAEARDYAAAVRGRVLDLLERLSLEEGPTRTLPRPAPGRSPSQSSPPPATELTTGAFVHGMVVQHEHQHIETMLATLNLAQAPDWLPEAPDTPAGDVVPGEVLVDGGPFVMGTDAEPWAYDNERPAHVVDLQPFWIDVAPVTNGQYLAFVESGGYSEPRWWSLAGWAWREESGIAHPAGWSSEGAASWSQIRFGRRHGLALDEPVEHVCWYEADAFSRWAGKRLPTEPEWEKAASWGPDGHKRPYPWGDDDPTPAIANLGQRHLGPAPVGAYPAGVSPWGCHQMIGDVWEWTASDFLAYPGFASFPYREYSEVFYGSDYKVLRGGSWATDPTAVRTTFRNWDYPIRRQIFAGFRCARDACEGPVCRLLGYLGPTLTLEQLLLEPEHSLLRQSWAPERQTHGTVNADGFGAGWYDLSTRPEPARYRRAGPMWADRSFASLAGLVRTGAVLAGVRSATPPAPAEESGTPPFTWGPWLFAHNGAVDGFRDRAGATLRRALSDRRLVGVEGAADSEVLFALALDRLDDGAAPEEALASVVGQVTAVTTGRLTMMLTDGQRLAAAVCGEALYRIGSDDGSDGLVVASEPSDARPDWRRLAEGSLLSATDGGARVRESSL